jgi:Trk K+ transport system NAD-binding subunit
MRVNPRKLKASWRDTTLLLRQFRQPLILFSLALLVGASLYYQLARGYGEPIRSFGEAVYLMLTLTFLQAGGEFPTQTLLQVFYFVMPLIGLVILAQGLADFGYLLFNRRARSKEWEMAVASTFENHTILVGLGHLGYRVAQNLSKMEEPVVVIELNPNTDLVGTVQAMNIPVIQDDATRQTILEAAGIRRAKTIVLCSQNDSMNLQIAVKARNLNPAIRVVIRIFDDDFAESLQRQFGFLALSATSMAAPAFAASAAGADVTRPITVEGQALSLGRLTVKENSKLHWRSVAEIESTYDVSVVLLKNQGKPDLHPTGSQMLQAGDVVAVLGSPDRLNAIVHDNQ